MASGIEHGGHAKVSIIVVQQGGRNVRRRRKFGTAEHAGTKSAEPCAVRTCLQADWRAIDQIHVHHFDCEQILLEVVLDGVFCCENDGLEFSDQRKRQDQARTPTVQVADQKGCGNVLKKTLKLNVHAVGLHRSALEATDWGGQGGRPAKNRAYYSVVSSPVCAS